MGAICFNDVAPDAWYKQAVASLPQGRSPPAGNVHHAVQCPQGNQKASAGQFGEDPG